jgi:hypothetical protein
MFFCSSFSREEEEFFFFFAKFHRAGGDGFK